MKEKKPKLKIVEYKNRTEIYRKINGKYRMIHIKWSDGDERWYDENGNVIHEKWSDGIEYWYDYDEKENMIHEKWSDGTEAWYDYDKQGNLIHEKWLNGTEYWYDENGNTISKEKFEKIFDKKKNRFKSDKYPIIRYVEDDGEKE